MGLCKMRQCQNELHPKSFLSNFWGCSSHFANSQSPFIFHTDVGRVFEYESTFKMHSGRKISLLKNADVRQE